MSRRVRGIAALGLAVVTALATWLFLRSLTPTAPVVVVAKDLDAHTPISADALKVAYVHPTSVGVLAPKAFTSVDEVKSLVTTRALKAGEVLRNVPEMVAEPGNLSSLASSETLPFSALVPPGSRAVTIALKHQANVRAGDRVDIYSVAPDAAGQPRARLLLAGVPVLLAGEASRGNTITVLVKQGQDASLVESRPNLDVVLAPLGGGGN
ncbi:MAG: RcpC/CpaB family pilus assembly protein [Bacillota bacterium]